MFRFSLPNYGVEGAAYAKHLQWVEDGRFGWKAGTYCLVFRPDARHMVRALTAVKREAYSALVAHLIRSVARTSLQTARRKL